MPDPQLLSSTIVSNPPFFLTAMMAIGRPLMSKKTLEKMKICPAETSPGQLGRCPYASISFGETELPTFLGGSCTCEDKGRTGCIQNVPNTADKPPNPTLDLVKAAARFAADVDGKASGTGNWRGQTITWTSVSLASKESKTIELGTLDPGVYPDGHPDTAKGGALTFLAYLPQPTARSSGAHVTFHAANPVFVDRRVKIHDTSRTWVETAHAVKLSVKVDNKDKAAKEVRIGFGWISGAEMAVISGA